MSNYENVRIEILQTTGRFVPLWELESDSAVNEVKSKTLYDEPENLSLAATACRNLQDIGFTMSPDLLQTFACMDRNRLIQEYNALYKACADQIGKNELQNAMVFYPNFPDEVMSMSDADIFINQLTHYFGAYVLGVTILPDVAPAERTPLLEAFDRSPKIIDLGTRDDVLETARNLAQSNNTLPEAKMKLLEDILDMKLTQSKYDDLSQVAAVSARLKFFRQLLPVPNKENRAALANYVNDHLADHLAEDTSTRQLLSEILRDATDVARFAANLSNGRTVKTKQKVQKYVWHNADRSDRHLEWRTVRKDKVIDNKDLSKDTRFKLTSQEKRLVMHLLSKTHDLYTGVWLNPDAFKNLFRSLPLDKNSHVKEVANNLFTNTKVNEFGAPIRSPYAIVENAIESYGKDPSEKNLQQLDKAVHDFPGVFNRSFLRAVDRTLSPEKTLTPATIALLEIYQRNCGTTPIRELLKMKNLISRIDTDKQKDSFRTIFISSKNEYRDIDPSPYVKWDHSVIEASLDAVQGTIRSKYLGVREFDTVKTVALVPQTKGLLLPENGERSSSKGAVLASGSFVSGNPEANIMRQFIWWTNGQNNTVDIDTAVTFIDAKGDVIGECAYYQQRAGRGDRLIAIHSGDIVDGGPVDGKGAAEFLDIDKTKALEAGAKYAVLSVHAYSNQSFSELPNVKFGYMQREGELEDFSNDEVPDIICGEIYEPKTVDICIDLNSNTTQTVPVIYNLETDQIYWLDKPYNVKGNVLRNAASEQSRAAIASMINRLETSVTPTVMDLFSAHINYREDLEYTDSIETADIVVCVRPEDVAGKTKSDAQIISALDIDKISAEWMRGFSKESPLVENEHDVDHGMEPPADYDYHKLYDFIMESEGYLNDDIGDDLDAGDDLDVD